MATTAKKKSAKTKKAPVGGKSFARRLGVEENASFEERKLMVLREAAAAFCEKGIAKTSIDDIAERLGVTKPTIYHYARSKDQMIMECLGEAERSMAVWLEKLESEPLTGRERIQSFFESYVESITDDFSRLFVNIDPHALSDESRKEFGKTRRHTIEIVRKFVDEGIADSSLRSDDPHLLTMALLGVFNFVGQWHRSGDGYANEEVVSGMMNVLLHGAAG